MGIEAAILGGAAISGAASIIGADRASSAARDAGEAQAGAAREATALQREIFETTREDLAPFRDVGVTALGELSRIFLGAEIPSIQTRQGEVPPRIAEIDTEIFNLDQQRRRSGATAEINARIEALIDERASVPAGIPIEPRALSEEERLEGFFESPPFTFVRDEGEKAINRALAARGESDSGAALRSLTEFNTGLASQEFDRFANRLAQLAGGGQSATTATGAFGQNFAGQAGQNILDAGTARASGIVGSANAFNQGLGGVDFAIQNALTGLRGGGAPATAPAGPRVVVPPQNNVFAEIF